MALKRFLMFLVMLFLKSVEGGGHHGGHHRDHLKIYLPEFIHHDRHTKVITIHHHHHKPKQHHHHHHHHHHTKPLVLPYTHGMYHRKKTHLVSKDQTLATGPVQHVHHIAGYAPQTPIRDFPGYMPYQNTYEESPAFKYDSSVTLKNSVNSFSPAAPTLKPSIPKIFSGGIPQIHGVQRTVKQVTSYDTLSGTVPNSDPSTVGTGYKVMEEEEEAGKEEDDTKDDFFEVVNPGQGSFQGAYRYLHQADFTPDLNNHFTQQSFQTKPQSHDLHEPTSPQFAPISANGIESYSGNVNSYFSSGLSAAESPSASDVPDQPLLFDGSEYSDPVNTFSSDFVGE